MSDGSFMLTTQAWVIERFFGTGLAIAGSSSRSRPLC